MTASRSGKTSGKPFILGKRGEEILRAVSFYRYMTALDITHLFYSPKSLTRVRSMLNALCGGGDYVGNQYLYRLCLPDIFMGNPERIYILGSRGRDFLEREGLSVKWYFRPDRVTHLSHSQVMHNLVLTRVLVAAHRWAALHPGFLLPQVRICYELGALTHPVDVAEKGKREKVTVIPDAWLLVEKLETGKAPVKYPVLLEIDRGTMFRERFKKHLLSRIEFVISGEYLRMFGEKAVQIAYVNTGATGDIQEGRRNALCLWTKEALQDIGKERWASIFRFRSVSLKEIYQSALFVDCLWYRLDSKEPVELFGE